MLDTIISSTTGESFTLVNALLIIVTSIILGLVISFLYIKTNGEGNTTSGFAITLIMLPVIISIIILLVGSNVARAFSLAGAFSIIRFRSAPGDPKDISYIFFTLAVGLAAGMGYVGYAILFTIILSVVMLVLEKVNYAKPKDKCLELRMTVPENLNYEEVFDETLKKYTTSYNLLRVKTKEFGAVFELSYKISMSDGSQKKFLDELRCKNGNLSISLTSMQNMIKEYV